MDMVYPDYFDDFRCIAHKCRHNCCIGWEIDIDKDSLDYYLSVEGEFGNKLRDNISLEGEPHFILKSDDRCPFLDNCNLCEIFSLLGENKLCQICSDHPRFYNLTEHHTEAGLGLCCEEAARIILTKESATFLKGASYQSTDILSLRDKCIDTMQNRSQSIPQRLSDMLGLFGIENYEYNFDNVLTLFEKLERLDDKWSNILRLVKSDYKSADREGFANHMKKRTTEYEQLICYLIYRHMPKAEFLEDAALYGLFSALAYRLLYTMGEVMYTNTGSFSVEDQIELARLFSSEIEYSDENIDLILGFLYTEKSDN